MLALVIILKSLIFMFYKLCFAIVKAQKLTGSFKNF